MPGPVPEQGSPNIKFYFFIYLFFGGSFFAISLNSLFKDRTQPFKIMEPIINIQNKVGEFNLLYFIYMNILKEANVDFKIH